MPERQQTQGDFGLRPVSPKQQMTDTYSAPRLPKPDLSELDGIVKLSKTAMEVMDFQQKQFAYQKKKGKELGEAQPDFELGKGTTEAALAGFQEGRGAALKTRFQNDLDSNWKIATIQNEHLLNSEESYGVYHDQALQGFIDDHKIEGIALTKFLEGADSYKTKKQADHIVASLGYQKKLFLNDADNVVLSTLSNMEGEAAFINNMSVFDLVTATDDLIKEDGSLAMPTSIYTLSDEEIKGRRQQLRKEVALARVDNVQNMLDSAYVAGPQTLIDVETKLIAGFIHELTDGTNPDMAFMVMSKLTTGTGNFIDRPAVIKALRENAEDIEKNANALRTADSQHSVMASWLADGGGASRDTVAEQLGVTGKEADKIIEQEIVRQSADANEFAQFVATASGVEKLPDLGARLLFSLGLARAGKLTKSKDKEEMITLMDNFNNLQARVGEERTIELLGINDVQYRKLNFMSMMLLEKDDEGKPVYGAEALNNLAMLQQNMQYVKDIPSDAEFRNELEDVGHTWASYFAFGFDEDADTISTEALNLAKSIYQYHAMDEANADLDSDQLLSRTVEHMENMNYDILNDRLIRTTPELGVDELKEIETMVKHRVVKNVRKQKDAFRKILKEVRKENTLEEWREGNREWKGESVLGVMFSEWSHFLSSPFDGSRESWKEQTAHAAIQIYNERNPNDSFFAENQFFGDFDYDEWLNFDDDEDDIPLMLISDHTTAKPTYRFINPMTNRDIEFGGDKLRTSYSSDQLIKMRKKRAAEHLIAEDDREFDYKKITPMYELMGITGGM